MRGKAGLRNPHSGQYTIVRSVEFMEDFNEWWKDEILKDGISDPRAGDFPRQFIACKDLASLAVQAFNNPEEWIGPAINVAGDEMTNTEMAEIFSRVLGRPVPLNLITWEEWEERYHIPSVIVDVWKWYNKTRFVADVKALRKQYPNMQRLEDFLRETGWDKF
ncbi:NmrA family NAD(P)-binding protein [Thermodesulfobacteriota bacterium]